MVELSNISFSFNRKTPLFENLTLSLQAGRNYGLFGLNGAGKTTLLNLMSGMLFPASGSCNIAGMEVRKRLPSVMSQLFIVPEQFELPPLTPERFTVNQKPFYPRFDSSEMEHLMHQFNIDPQKVLTQHSYGQRKKFLIAFSLAANTPLLLMDEPTNGLDIPSKSQFRKVMSETESARRCTFISTHQVRDLESIIDHMTVLHSGKIIFNQSVSDIAERLTFKKTAGVPPESLYSEETTDGYHTLFRRLKDEQGERVDLELLFNSIIQKTDSINHVFDNS